MAATKYDQLSSCAKLDSKDYFHFIDFFFSLADLFLSYAGKQIAP